VRHATRELPDGFELLRLCKGELASLAARESRPEIPDLGKRGDEIGDLNDALRSMTDALWQRIGTIESFAADVAHELKNPLTSLRSAIEVAARPNLEPERRDKLMAIVFDDINRLNRLLFEAQEQIPDIDVDDHIEEPVESLTDVVGSLQERGLLDRTR